MADWTTIPDSSVEPGKPIRSIDGLALRDNPVAIAEGAAGAPRIQTPALSRGAYVRQGQGSGMSSNEVYIGWSSGATLLAQVDVTPMGTIHTSALGTGEVGTYAFLGSTNTTAVAPGSTKAGSSLRYAGVLGGSSFANSIPSTRGMSGGTTTPSGTWRCMGRDGSFTVTEDAGYGATLWLRIA